jgi:thiol-disulfide isomerase/thioredoxin
MKRNLLLLPAVLSLIAAGPPTTAPAVQHKSDPNMLACIQAARGVQVLVPHLAVLQDPARRTALAPDVIPALNKFFIAEQALESANGSVLFINALDPKYRAEMIAFGGTLDPAGAIDKHPEVSKQLAAFLMGNGDKQTAMVAGVTDKLNTDVNDPNALQLLTQMVACSEGASDLKSAMANTISEVKTARHSKITLAEVIAAKDANRAMLVDKPLVLEGDLVDGTKFSTASYKGKVVMVDFWATWCVPCKFGLPQVKAMYKKYHADGLEIVSVSNDMTADALKAYLKDDPDMVWPQFFDPKAGATKAWNPITVAYGVDSIPRMFLIDRQGICRSITARQDMETLIPKLLAQP